VWSHRTMKQISFVQCDSFVSYVYNSVSPMSHKSHTFHKCPKSHIQFSLTNVPQVMYIPQISHKSVSHCFTSHVHFSLTNVPQIVHIFTNVWQVIYVAHVSHTNISQVIYMRHECFRGSGGQACACQNIKISQKPALLSL